MSENVALKENFQVVSVKSLQSGGQFSHTSIGVGWEPEVWAAPLSNNPAESE